MNALLQQLGHMKSDEDLEQLRQARMANVHRALTVFEEMNFTLDDDDALHEIFVEYSEYLKNHFSIEYSGTESDGLKYNTLVPKLDNE